jgi:hypothetical protein
VQEYIREKKPTTVLSTDIFISMDHKTYAFIALSYSPYLNHIYQQLRSIKFDIDHKRVQAHKRRKQDFWTNFLTFEATNDKEIPQKSNAQEEFLYQHNTTKIMQRYMQRDIQRDMQIKNLYYRFKTQLTPIIMELGLIEESDLPPYCTVMDWLKMKRGRKQIKKATFFKQNEKTDDTYRNKTLSKNIVHSVVSIKKEEVTRESYIYAERRRNFMLCLEAIKSNYESR